MAATPMVPVFEASAVFYLSQTYAAAAVPFQLHVSLPERLALDQLHFDSLRVVLSNGSDVVVRHKADVQEVANAIGVRLVKIAEGKEGVADLTWTEDARTLVVSGWTKPSSPGPISVSPLVPFSLRSHSPPSSSLALRSLRPSCFSRLRAGRLSCISTRIRRRPDPCGMPRAGSAPFTP